MDEKRRSRERSAFPAAMLTGLAFLGTLAPGAGRADDYEGPPLKFELTPYAGYRVGGAFKYGDTGTHVDVRDHVSLAAAFDVATDESTQYELFYSRQATTLKAAPALAPSDTVIEYLHIGGTVLYEELQPLRPYIIGTIGATRFTPDSPVGRDRIYFSASLGAGLRIPFSSHLALRLEARGFATFFNSNSAVFCRSDQTGGMCLIHGSGSTFFQGDALAGLAYTF